MKLTFTVTTTAAVFLTTAAVFPQVAFAENLRAADVAPPHVDDAAADTDRRTLAAADFTVDLVNSVCPGLVVKGGDVAPSAEACAALCEGDAGCDAWQ